MRPRLMSVLALGALVLTGCGSTAGPSAPAQSSPSPAAGWHRVEALPGSQGGSARDVVATGTGFVAVGSSGLRGPGAAWTSTDGASWQATPGEEALATLPLDAVVVTGTGLDAFGADCAGTGECVTTNQVSFDGSAWSKVPDFVGATGAEPVGFASNGGRLVGVGSEYVSPNPVVYAGRAWTSPTGGTWTQVPDSPAFAKAEMNDVAVGPHGLVAVGSAQTDSEIGTDAAVWTSPDGLAWTRLPSQPDFADASMFAISDSPSGLVAVGQGAQGAAAWTSTDGTRWVRVADAPALHDAAMHGVASGSSGLIAVGYGHDSAVIWTSPDATTWTRVPDAPTFAMAQAVAVAVVGDEAVAVGGANGETSPAAIIWSNH